MADLNSLVLDVASWVGRAPWAAAPAPARERYLAEVAGWCREAKLRQVLRGVGGDGRPLEPRLRPRADGASGKPLSPHRRESRSYRWARASTSRARGTVTLWWSHGWGRILGYHARGEVLGTFLRDLIGFPPGVERHLKGRARKLWADLEAGRVPGIFARAPEATPVAARGRRAPDPVPADARAFVRRYPDLREYATPPRPSAPSPRGAKPR